MGERARKEWERWFSDEVLFHRLVELCLDIRNKRQMPEALGRWTAYLQFLERSHFRRMLGGIYRAFRGTVARPPAQAQDVTQP